MIILMRYEIIYILQFNFKKSGMTGVRISMLAMWNNEIFKCWPDETKPFWQQDKLRRNYQFVQNKINEKWNNIFVEI
jgi:hypothetical protein